MSIRKLFKVTVMYGAWLFFISVPYVKAEDYVTINGGVGNTGVNYGKINITYNNGLMDERLQDVKTSLEKIIKELKLIGHDQYKNVINNIEYSLKRGLYKEADRLYSDSYYKYGVGNQSFNRLSADISELYYLDVLKRKEIYYYKSYLGCRSCQNNKRKFDERKRVIRIILDKIQYNKNILNNYNINCLNKRVYFEYIDSLSRLLIDNKLLSRYKEKGGISCLDINGYIFEYFKGMNNKGYYYFSHKNKKINGMEVEKLKKILQIKTNEILEYPKKEDIEFLSIIKRDRERFRVYLGSHNDFSKKINLLEYDLTNGGYFTSNVSKDVSLLDVVVIFAKGQRD